MRDARMFGRNRCSAQANVTMGSGTNQYGLLADYCNHSDLLVTDRAPEGNPLISNSSKRATSWHLERCLSAGGHEAKTRLGSIPCRIDTVCLVVAALVLPGFGRKGLQAASTVCSGWAAELWELSVIVFKPMQVREPSTPRVLHVVDSNPQVSGACGHPTVHSSRAQHEVLRAWHELVAEQQR